MIWTYWEGPKPDWIGLCHETLLHHHPEAVILDPESIREMDLPLMDIPLDRLSPAQRADYIRLCLLVEYGGMRLDSDCIVLRRMNWFVDSLNIFDFITYGLFSTGPKCCNALMASRHDGLVVRDYLDAARRTLQAGGRLGRNALGPTLLGRIVRESSRQRIPLLRMGGELIHPIPFGLKSLQAYRVRASDSDHEKIYQSNAWCYMLTHRALGPERRLSRDDLINSTSFAGFLFRKGLGLA